MSTRGCIARLAGKDPPAFKGVYHHWDSYPSGLGRALFRLWNVSFRMNTERMLKALIDDHPAGWSTIVGRSFDTKPSFSPKERRDLPECYCHGQRSEKAWVVTHQNAAASGVEFVYAFDRNRMLIMGSFLANGAKMVGMFGAGDADASWRVIAEIDLRGKEPDWLSLDEKSGTARGTR